MKLIDALAQAQEILKSLDFPAKEAYSILQAALELDHPSQIRQLNPETELKKDQISSVLCFAKRRAKGEPMAYIRGWEKFWGEKIITNPSVLIPRPETEFLVQIAIEKIQQMPKDSGVILDLCTGSGAISRAIYKELPQLCENFLLIASDLSLEALDVARLNLLKLPVSILRMNYLSGVADHCLDMILSNPPYIPWEEKNQLSKDILEHEPHLALFEGEAGLAGYQIILPQAYLALKSGGILLLECGINQASSIKKIWQGLGGSSIGIHEDFRGIERNLCLQKPF